MADSMRMTSVIGAAPRGRDPRRGALSRARSGARNLGPPRASYLLSQQLLVALTETMSIPPAWPQVLDFFGTPLVIEPSPGQLSGDAGLLPVRQFDERIGLTQAFTAAGTGAVAVVHGLLVSSRDVAAAALGRGQGGD